MNKVPFTDLDILDPLPEPLASIKDIKLRILLIELARHARYEVRQDSQDSGCG